MDDVTQRGRMAPTTAHLPIVDDEANTLASLARAFRLAGHEATVCDNPVKALELAKAQKFDMILSDVKMPGKDGLALLEELKTQGVAAPVVMMSGQAEIEMAVRATRRGDAARDSASGAHRGKRDAGLHPGGDGHGERASGTDDS